jgi:hypothetical protein
MDAQTMCVHNRRSTEVRNAGDFLPMDVFMKVLGEIPFYMHSFE